MKYKVVLSIKLLGNRSGGAERLYCELANWLSQRDEFEVYCVTYESNYAKPFYPINKNVKLINLYLRPDYRSFITKLAKVTSVGKLKHISNFVVDNYDYILQLKRFLKGNSIDVCVSFLPPANTASLLACNTLDTKIIACNHNVPEQDYENPERWSNNPVDIYLRKKLVHRADKIHVLFDDFALWFDQKRKNDIVTINNYIPNTYFEPRPKSITERENVIIAVGRLSPVKNYELLVHAWAIIHKKHPTWKVKLFGKGPQEKLLKKLIKDYDIADSFLLMGHTVNIIDEYDNSKILAHPALYEGFGLSVAEALARDLPVVAFADCKGVNQYVINEYNGLMIDGDKSATEYSSKLSYLIEDQNKFTEISENCNSSVETFSEVKYYQAWEKLMLEVLEP